MPIEKSDLLQIAELLSRHGVEFIVIGGQAEALMGSGRMTYDVDLCYRRRPENLDRLSGALKTLQPRLRGAPPDLPIIIDARALSLRNNYSFETSLGTLVLLGWVEPLGDYEIIFKNAEVYSVGNLQLRTISLDDLIRVKEHIGRAKDRESLWQLMAIRRMRTDKTENQPGG